MVAPVLSPAPFTYATPSSVVICSITIRKSGKRWRIGIEHPLDEHRLAIINVHRRIGHFSMHAKRHIDLAYLFEHRIDRLDAADTAVRIGRRTSRIEFQRLDETVPDARFHIRRVCAFGQIEGHQRLEPVAFGKSG